MSPRSLQRRFSFNFEFHHNYLIDYLIGYLMFDVIITSFEIFESLLGCNYMYICSSDVIGYEYLHYISEP